MPFDLVPDFIPVAGQVDDAIIVALVLRTILRAGGPNLLSEHWPGPTSSRNALMRLAYFPRACPALEVAYPETTQNHPSCAELGAYRPAPNESRPPHMPCTPRPDRTSPTVTPTSPAPVGAAILCSLGALLLAGLAVLVVVLASGSCEYACPSDAAQLLPGAVLLALTWLPMAPGIAVMLQRRGRNASAFSWAANGIAFVLTSYLFAVGGLAWGLASSHEIPHTDLAWGIYALSATVAWVALALTLVAVCTRR